MNNHSEENATEYFKPSGTEELRYYDYPAYKLSIDLYLYVPPFLFVLGTIGGIMILIIMQRRSISNSSSSDYFKALAVADMLALYVGMTRYWLRALVDIDIRKLTSWGCKLHYFSLYSLTHYSAWILVAVSIERFISVCFPFKARILCTQTNSRFTLLALLVGIFGINAHFFWTRGERVRIIKNETIISICTVTSPSYYDFDDYVWPWIDLSMLSLIPALVMTVCSICITSKIYMARRNRVADLSADRSAENSPPRAKMTTMTAMLLFTNVVFVLLSSPVAIFIIADRYWRNSDHSEDHEATLYLVSSCVILLDYLNHSINFVMYCVCGPRFRRELKAMFCSSRVYPQANSVTVE